MYNVLKKLLCCHVLSNTTTIKSTLFYKIIYFRKIKTLFKKDFII